jgi:hypothetical protein
LILADYRGSSRATQSGARNGFAEPRDRDARFVDLILADHRGSSRATQSGEAAVEGRLPRGIGVTRLRDAPAKWSRQYAMLGLSI